MRFGAIENQSKIDPKSVRQWMEKRIHKMVKSGSDFGSILEPSWAWKRESRQAKTGQDRKSKNVKKPLVFLMIFEVWGDRKAIKNRSKIGSKVDEERDAQNCRFRKRFWVDFGAKLGRKREPRQAKTGQDRPRQAKTGQD